MWERICRKLFPDEAEVNEGFRQEILRQSHSGLRVIGAVSIGAALFLMIGWWIFFRGAESTIARIKTDLILISIGVLIISISRMKWTYPHSRLLALVIVEFATAILLSSSLYLTTLERAAEDFIPSQITLGVLIMVVAIPLKPWQTLLHCCIVGGIYALVIEVAQATFLPSAAFQLDYCLFIAMLSLLATGLSAILYEQRREAYFSYLQTLQAADELRQTQSRLAMSESASSMARLAAAISHELNTPIGALSSAVDTLLLLGSRQASAPPEQLPRLVKLQADLRKSIQDSAQRLQQIGARVARFTNLDQATIQPTKVNDLVSDVAELIRPRLPKDAQLTLDLSPLADVVGNPQQLSAIFYDLMNNSATALNSHGHIQVRTRQVPDGVEIQVEDNGHGIEKEKLSQIFDPGFQETSGRMASGNWSMFTARQVVREHGGEISITSQLGSGTKVTIELPFGHIT